MMMMKQRILTAFLGTLLCTSQAFAQTKTVTGKVTRDVGVPLSGVSVVVKGTPTVVQTNNTGEYSIRADVGQVLQYRLIGYVPQERTVGTAAAMNVQLTKAAAKLDAVVVTARGQTTTQRNLGTSQQTVSGADVAQTGRENFINGLQGRVAGDLGDMGAFVWPLGD